MILEKSFKIARRALGQELKYSKQRISSENERNKFYFYNILLFRSPLFKKKFHQKREFNFCTVVVGETRPTYKSYVDNEIKCNKIFFPREENAIAFGTTLRRHLRKTEPRDCMAYDVMGVMIYVLRRKGIVRDWRRAVHPDSSRRNATPRKPVTSPATAIPYTLAVQPVADHTKVMIKPARVSPWQSPFTLKRYIIIYRRSP